MKSPDEFHYGIDPPREEPNGIRCARCGDPIKHDDAAAVIETRDGNTINVHERCLYKPLTLEEAAELFRAYVSECRGYELEEE